MADLEGKYLSVNPAWTPTLGWSNLICSASLPDGFFTQMIRIKPMTRSADLPPGEKRCVLKAVSATRMARIVGFHGKLRHIAAEFTQWDGTSRNSKMPRIYCGKPGGTRTIARRTTLTTMTASIAHEINQPLAAMAANGNAGLRWLTRTEPDLDEVRQALERVVENSNRAR